MKNRELLLASALILIGFIYRLIPFNIANVTPVAAMALLGGLYLNKKWLAFLVPLAALFASDIILNNTVNRIFFQDRTGFIVFADYMMWTYAAFMITVLIGFALTQTKGMTKILVGGFTASLLFFVLTNFGTWLTGGLYPKNFAGLSACFAAAIPFFRNTLIGNMFFVTITVGAVELYRARKSKLQMA